MKKVVVILIMFIPFISACQMPDGSSVIDVPPEVRELAAETAYYYIGMPYVYGGGDWAGPRHIEGVGGIDCSGLIVNIYKRATDVFDESLLFSDATVASLLNKYTRQIDNPEIGDLLFMGEDSITHVAVFVRDEDGMYYFIDAYSVTGVVEERSYEKDDPKFKQFGRILVLRKG